MSKLLKLKSSKIVLGLMVVAMMFTAAPMAVEAALTDGQVNAIILFIQEFGVDATTIANVRASLTGGTPVVATPGSSLDFGTATLRVGSSGIYVTNLQTLVGATADGNFGPMTKAAVMTWQSANGLVADGLFGPASRAAAGAVAGTPSTPSTPATPTGPIGATLASDTPASASFIYPASGIEFAKYTFTGTGTVTSITLMRTGVSASTTLSNVYLYDGTTRLTDGSSISSDNTVTFNSPSGIFAVAGSKTITVVADSLAAGGYSLGFNLTGYTANEVTSVVSVAGNQMFGASATLATIAIASATGSGDTDPGLDITVWQGTATVSTRDVLLKSLALRQIGSINSDDIVNFKLYADGILVSTVANLDANKYVTFATSYALKTGARTLKVTADIIGGSSRTAQMSLRGSYDILATDTQYNSNGTATGTFPFGPSAFTLNAGSLTVIKKTDSQASNITLGASDQIMASYTFTAYGEPIKVETLRVGMIQTGGGATSVDLRNVRILVDGAQVGSNTTVPAAASFATNTGTSFTTNFIVYPGSPAIVEIHSDIFDNDGTDEIADGTVTSVQALLVGGADVNNGVPQVSITAIDVPTADNVLGNNLTISSGTMSLATTSNYVNRNIAVPQTAYKIASFQLTGNSTEAVNLNTLYVGWPTGSTIVESTSLSDLYIVYGGTTTTVKGTVTSSSVASTASTNSNSWSVNKTLAINETMQIDVYATLATSVSTDAIITELAVAGTTAASGVATYADASDATSLSAGVAGQTITGATGTLVMSQDASTAVSQLVDDSGTIKTLAAKIVATTDSYTVTDATVTITNVTAVSSVTLKNHDTGAVVGATKSAATSLTWSGLSLDVNAGTTVKLDVELVLAPVGTSAGTTDSALTTAITTITARNGAGTSAATGAGTVSGTATGNAIYIYKSVPTVTSLAVDSNLAAGAGKVIAKFTVSSNGTGTVAWKQVMFEISKTATPTIASVALYNADTGEIVTAAEVFQNGTGGVATTCSSDNTVCELLITVGTDADDDAMEQISGAKTYEVRATIGGAIAVTDNISITLDRNSTTHTAVNDFVAIENDNTAGDASFVWSDESFTTTGSTDVDTNTWLDDFLIKTLPAYWSLN